MHTVSRLVAFASAAAFAALCGAANPPAPRTLPAVPPPQQAPGQTSTQNGAAASKVWNVILAVTQIMDQVIQAVISVGGWGNGADQSELVAVAVGAEVTATVTTIEQLPDLITCQQVTVMIAGFQQQNVAAGKPLPNQLTGAQIQLLMQRISIVNASNPRLANDLKVLVGRLPKS